MSISSIGNGALGGVDDALAQMRQSGSMEQGIQAFAQSMVERRDADGDGSLNLEETGLKEDVFGGMDADGNGLLSSEEIGAQVKEKMEQMNSMMGQLSVLMQSIGNGDASDKLASAIMEHDDADGDGLLSLEESGVDESFFSTVDADGDGYVSTEEISANIDDLANSVKNLIGGSSDGAQTTSETTETEKVASSGSSGGSGGGSGGSGDSDDDEDYDEYDLNKDGVVSADEYLQAYMNGDMSLSDMFGDKRQNDGQSLVQRLAMEAYGAQSVLG